MMVRSNSVGAAYQTRELLREEDTQNFLYISIIKASTSNVPEPPPNIPAQIEDYRFPPANKNIS